MTMAFRFGATPAYAGIVHDRVDSLREERLGGLLTIGEFLARRYEPAMRTVTSAHDRLQETLEQARRAGELLCTRVDTPERPFTKTLPDLPKWITAPSGGLRSPVAVLDGGGRTRSPRKGVLMLTSSVTSQPVDVYRTRLAARSQVEPRPPPVVWGERRPGPLTAEQVAGYEERGYHTDEQVLDDDDITACYTAVEEITDRLGEDPRVVRETSNGAVRSVFSVHELSETIADVCARPEIRGVAEQILGDEVYVHQSRINLKPGFGGGPFYWHSDFETWHAEDGMPAPRALSVSLALTPNLETNGALMIIPGSHKSFVSCVGETPQDYHEESLVSYRPPVGTPEEEDVTALGEEHGIDLITGGAGSALYFDSNCMHASAGNISPFPRSNLFVVFNAVSNRLRSPFAAEQPRPEHLASRARTA